MGEDAAEAEPSAAPAEGASVGVLGWLGFVIVNFAAFGIIGAGTTISWVIGFVLSILYTGVLVALAVILQKRGAQYVQFVNLLWVLACLFLFIDGVYMSINVLGPLDGTDVTGDDSWTSDNDLSALLPNGASQALQDWSQGGALDYGQGPHFATFGGLLFFPSPPSDDQSWPDVLWRTNVSHSSVVDPVLEDPRSFVEFGAELFFAARSAGSSQDGVYYVDGASPEGTAQLLYSSVDSTSSFQVRALFVDVASSSLYFSVSYYCDDSGYTESLFRSDGTPSGTDNLRDSSCVGTTTSSNGELPERGADAEYWGIIFVAAIPMMALAAYVMYSRQIYGVFANVYGGVATVCLMIFLLASDDMGGLLEFNKWFFTIYSSTLYVALLALAVVRDSLPEWLEEMKTWAVALVAVTFFNIIHVDLEIPFSGEAWAWVLYAVLALLQMAASVVLKRTMPMVGGSLCAFVLSWKISWETVVLLGGEDWGGGLQLLTVFGLMALLGIGIIVLAVVYASRRESIEAFVQDAIRRWRGEKAIEPSSEAASAP